jgi:2-(1,2-epoxy-1,2-dihydrophenyl)acetyl-CoA isomerase
MEHINFAIEEGVAIIQLNRPKVYNSFNRAMALEVQSALDQCAENKDVRCICITGSGKAFSAGQDLQEIIAEDGPDLPVILKEHYNPIIERIVAIEKPIVAAINGVAAGAGANIALACDITIAKSSATFIQAFSKIGLIPDSAGTYFLPRIVGRSKAMALAMLGDKVTAEDAEKMGMIYKVVQDELFEDDIKKVCLKLAKMPTLGLGLTKRAINQSYSNNVHQQLAVEDELQTKAGLSEDYGEGVRAFLEKRKPVFKGC